MTAFYANHLYRLHIKAVINQRKLRENIYGNEKNTEEDVWVSWFPGLDWIGRKRKLLKVRSFFQNAEKRTQIFTVGSNRIEWIRSLGVER